MVNVFNSAMAEWVACLQNEAIRLLQKGRLLQFNGVDLPDGWEMSLCCQAEAHRAGETSNVEFSSYLVRVAKMLKS